MEEKEIKFLQDTGEKQIIQNETIRKNTIKKQKYRKILIITIFLLLWIILKIAFNYISSDEGVTNSKYCFNDKLLTTILLPVTNFLSQNLTVRDTIIIFASSQMDIGLVTFGIIYIFKQNSWTYPLAFLLFYGSRSLIQSIFTMQFYDTFIFENPGFLSIVVPYFRTPDFFFSGHIGCSLILSLSFKDWGYTTFSYYYIFVLFVEALMMTLTRAHYSIDIIFGFIFGHYVFLLSKKASSYFDRVLPLCGTKNS